MDQRTYREWRSLGMTVIKGQKSCGRNEKGQCVFSRSQVTMLSSESKETHDESFEEIHGITAFDIGADF